MIEDGSAQTGAENLGVIERRLLRWAVVGAQHAGKIPAIASRFAVSGTGHCNVVKSKINVGDGKNVFIAQILEEMWLTDDGPCESSRSDISPTPLASAHS